MSGVSSQGGNIIAEKKMCNICGVPASEIKDGICRWCPGENVYCTMEPGMMVEERVYEYAKKHHLLLPGKRYGTFSPEFIRERFENTTAAKKAPRYFLNAISCDGMTFADLDSFPQDVVLRVCRGSIDGTFQVGDLVWRHLGTHPNSDGINFLQDAACLEARECAEALKGAHFEQTYHNVPKEGIGT